MELPEDVIRIIKEYSRPITRPDWRTLHKMTITHYYNLVIEGSYISVLGNIRPMVSNQWLIGWSNHWCQQREHNFSFTRKCNY